MAASPSGSGGGGRGELQLATLGAFATIGPSGQKSSSEKYKVMIENVWCNDFIKAGHLFPDQLEWDFKGELLCS